MNWLANKFELSRGGSRDNLRPMEGLRGFAVFMVFLVHFVTLSEAWMPSQSISAKIAYDLHKIGNSGVDLFSIDQIIEQHGIFSSRKATTVI